jgi:uncharacterized membrane protein
MPFCSQCGNQVGAADAYCGRCGAAQPTGPAPARPGTNALAGISPRTASILCYIPVVGWIASIVVLASDRFRTMRPIRFHAFQGLYLGVAWIMNDWALGRMLWFAGGMRHLHDLFNLVLLGASIFMMVKAAHEETFSLPILGELAQRSITED